jgi:hypothetical protein
MRKFLYLIAATAILAFTVSAGPIPYGNIGTQAPAATFMAAATGDVKAYFFATDAGYDSEIGLLVNGVDTGIYGLPNHSSSHGNMLDFGNVNAGDQLVFVLKVITTGSSWYSDPALNSDTANHVYSTAFGGDAQIPAGTYVAFEDLPNGSADWDYNDHQFVFTNVGSNIPEPSSFALVGLGLLAAGLTLRRVRFAKAD